MAGLERKGLALAIIGGGLAYLYIVTRTSSAASSSPATGGSSFGDWFQSLTETPGSGNGDLGTESTAGGSTGAGAGDDFTTYDPFTGMPYPTSPDMQTIYGPAPGPDPGADLTGYDPGTGMPYPTSSAAPNPDGGLLWGLFGGGNYGGLVDDAAARYGVPASIINGVIRQESGGNPTARNPTSSARGLMGMTRGAAQDVGADWEQLDNPAIAIDAGTAYLAIQINRFGQWDGVRAYYAGAGTVSSGTNAARLAEADAYANSVFA